MKLSVTLRLCCMLCFCSDVLLANDAETTQNESKSEQEEVIVTVATRQELPTTDLALSVSVISNDELNLITHRHVQETLNRVPGVNFHRGDGQEYLPSIRSPVFTGAGACGGLLILEDNIPIRPTGFCNINELFEANTELAERIEIIRGNGSVYYGSNALHGVINIITPTPEPGVQQSLEVADDGLYRSQLQIAGASDKQTLGMSINVGKYEGWRDESSYDQQKMSLKHTYQNSDLSISSGLSATNLNQETAGYINGKDSYLNRQLSISNNEPEGYRDVKSLRVWSRIEKQLNASAELIITPYFRHSDMQFLMHFLPGQPTESNGQSSAGMQTNYHLDLADDVQFRTGLDLEVADTYLEQFQENPTEGSAFLRETIPPGKQYDYEVTSRLISVFAELSKTINPQLKTGLGFRMESINYDYTNLMISGRLTEDGLECGFGGCRYNRPESSENSFDNWSADINIHYAYDDNLQLFGRLSRAFRAPQTTELYRLQREQTIADLDSESVSSIEVGLRYSAKQYNYQLTAYRMLKDNYIYRNSDFFNLSDGKTEHQGIELAYTYRSMNNWYWQLSSAFAKHTYDYDSVQDGVNIRGLDIDTAPRFNANSRLGWTDQAMQIELEWALADGYYLEPTNAHEYPGHRLWHVFLNYQVTKAMHISFRIRNLLDEHYAERADYTSFSGYRYFPGIPRQVSLSFGYRW